MFASLFCVLPLVVPRRSFPVSAFFPLDTPVNTPLIHGPLACRWMALQIFILRRLRETCKTRPSDTEKSSSTLPSFIHTSRRSLPFAATFTDISLRRSKWEIFEMEKRSRSNRIVSSESFPRNEASSSRCYYRFASLSPSTLPFPPYCMYHRFHYATVVSLWQHQVNNASRISLWFTNRSWRNELFEARYLSAFVPFTRFLLFATGRYLRRLQRR